MISALRQWRVILSVGFIVGSGCGEANAVARNPEIAACAQKVDSLRSIVDFSTGHPFPRPKDESWVHYMCRAVHPIDESKQVVYPWSSLPDGKEEKLEESDRAFLITERTLILPVRGNGQAVRRFAQHAILVRPTHPNPPYVTIPPSVVALACDANEYLLEWKDFSLPAGEEKERIILQSPGVLMQNAGSAHEIRGEKDYLEHIEVINDVVDAIACKPELVR